MLRVMTLNINGVRAGARKGFFNWFLKQDIDVLCLQETKAHYQQIADDSTFHLPGYQHIYLDAMKKGYSGVAIYSKPKILSSHNGLGHELGDTEGRYLSVELDNCIIASVYLPSGTSGQERQDIKYEVLDCFSLLAQKHQEIKKPILFCGDFNIAHRKIDIKNWRGNQKNSGFLPEERAWFDTLLNDLGYIDAFRHQQPELEQYSWVVKPRASICK